MTAGRKATDPLLGWHFVAEDGKERWGSRRRIQAGKTYRVRGTVALCEYGLHASERAIDALRYAPGPIACRVQLSGRILHDTDKAVATERTVLAMADATHLLHEFACWCAERAVMAERRAGREPDKRSWEAVRIKRLWLKGKASDEELSAAADSAARAADSAADSAVASAVARAAARAAADRAAARAADSAVASAVARAAADRAAADRAAARATDSAAASAVARAAAARAAAASAAAASAAASAVARAADRAAYSAAYGAAYSAERVIQNRKLERMLKGLLG